MIEDSDPTPGGGAICANCGEPLGGPFCSACGQENRNLARITVGQLVGEWFGNVFSFDSRLMRTLGPLVREPGLLTLEYLAGRRARHVPPLRLFVFLSLIMFVILAMAGTELSFELTGESGEQLVASGDRALGDDAKARAETDTATPAEPEGAPEKLASDADLGDLTQTTDAAELNRRLLDWAPRVALVLVPVIALILQLLHRRRQPLYMPHLIFTLHVHCFAFLLIPLAIVLDLPFSSFPPGKLLLLVGLPAYLYLAQKRVYGGGWLANVPRTALILVAQQAGFVVVMLPVLFLSAQR